MTNKIIPGLLVLLVLYAVGVGVYSYMLNQDVNKLSEKFSALQAEQTNRLDALDAGVVKLQNETMDRLAALEEMMEESLSDIDSKIETIQGGMTSINNEITGITSDLGTLNGRITELDEKIAESQVDLQSIYEQVAPATVRITDGEFTYGSGVIMDTDRHVLTAHHVIVEMGEIYVVMYDGTVSKATVVGASELSDIAVLELEKDPGVTPPLFADSSQFVPGATVFAIGSPSIGETELRDTITAGIISQVNRYEQIDDKWIPNLIQFDAPVNFGNSGGPLFNVKGEIAGVVVARINANIGDGIYWAVSANKAKRVADEIIEHGFFNHPWLGVLIENLLPEEVVELGLKTGNGVYVTGVFAGSPAEAAGITAGDIVLSVNGVKMRNIADLVSYLAEYTSPGDTVILEIIRDDTIIEVTVEMGSRA
jgi:S1-C subfamily serine protease